MKRRQPLINLIGHKVERNRIFNNPNYGKAIGKVMLLLLVPCCIIRCCVTSTHKIEEVVC